MIAHVGGVPVEESVVSLVGSGASLLVVRVWMAHYLRRR